MIKHITYTSENEKYIPLYIQTKIQELKGEIIHANKN
jgi:uncharacterized protein YlbG (UPF0298 family)